MSDITTTAGNEIEALTKERDSLLLRIGELERRNAVLEQSHDPYRNLLDIETRDADNKALESRLGRSEKLLGMVYTAMTTHGVLPWMRSQVEEWFKVETGEHRCTVWNAEGICDICGTNGRIVENQRTIPNE